MPEFLGENIKTAREAAGLTQEELGAIVGVTGVTIMRYEKGLREPKKDMISKLAEALHVTKAALMGWAREPDELDNAVLKQNPDYRLGNETIPEYLARKKKEKDPQPAQEGKPEISEDDIKFALFGGAGEITDEMYNEVKEFVRFVKMKHGQE